MQQVILEAKSTGKRGEMGYKKRYELFIGDNNLAQVQITFGRAEFSSWVSTIQCKYFDSPIEAQMFVDVQVRNKLRKGYEIVKINS